MYLKKLQIKNFKSFQDITIEFNEDVNILTGVNNAGKTTMLEAIALWHECFSKLIQEARRGTKNYIRGDYVLGNTGNKYFPYDQINSVRAPNFEDIFYQRDKRNKIELCVTFENTNEENLSVNFQIGQSGLNYIIELANNTEYDYRKFNDFFNFSPRPNPIGLYYASPVSAIGQKEKFVTKPQIQNSILTRKSAKVIRNRLYNLYHHSLFQEFITDLSYILFENKNRIEIDTPSKIISDVEVVFNFRIDSNDIWKEISLLGSGTLQIIEILLNFYNQDESTKDINFVLLDEPDSHIHRDIQNRLLKILTKFTKNTQIFLSTHNEALIRSAPIDYLFHLDAKPINSYRSLGNKNIQKQMPRFSGILPTLTNPIISSLGNSNGLDFVSAIEADCLIFVEGEDDARVFDILLKKGMINNRNNYVYWVLGGVSHIFKEITHYETVFSAIKNEKNLWDKSVLIFDRDYLDDVLLNKFSARLNKKLKTHIFSSYTLEATLFSDLDKLTLLLNKWLLSNGLTPNNDIVRNELNSQYSLIKINLQNKFDDKFYQERAHEYIDTIKKVDNIFGKPNINIDSINLTINLQNHIKKCLNNNELYKLMDKHDVAKIINNIAKIYDFSYTEEDFVSLIRCVDKSTWLDNWDFLLTI